MLIAKSGVPVVPIRIFGSHGIFPPGASRPSLCGKVQIVIGRPLHLDLSSGTGKSDYQAIADQVMEAIAALTIPGKSSERDTGNVRASFA
ncbi:MAG: hypothetical protein AAGJ31_13910 [Verrucomicrobiota bacterium]